MSSSVADSLERREVIAPDKDRQAPLYSDERLALLFAKRHACDTRYVAAWGKWMIWKLNRWEADHTLLTLDRIRAICRLVASTADHHATAKSVASAKTVAAVERLAKADRRLAASAEQWDRDLFALNTPEGVVDLKTGQLRGHDPLDYQTKVTLVSPRGDCVLWKKFLDRITGGDIELQAFLQRMVGYALTGSTIEHALFFLYGTGANGKSVFINTISNIMHRYHKTAPIETFTASSGERHPTDLAGLMGARLVTATETEEGRRWAESRVKSLTGGDKISARLMRQDFFEFQPHFKLLIAGNHKPGLRSVDEAIRRRFHLIPFTVTIPEAERDNQLAAKLMEEGSGILQWMIEGTSAWQREGLSPPEAVRAATEAYLEGEDSIAAWLEECCDRQASAEAPSSELFASWKAWAEKSGEYPGTTKSFSQKLEARSFVPYRTGKARGFRGLRLKVPDADDSYALQSGGW